MDNMRSRRALILGLVKASENAKDSPLFKFFKLIGEPLMRNEISLGALNPNNFEIGPDVDDETVAWLAEQMSQAIVNIHRAAVEEFGPSFAEKILGTISLKWN